MMLRAVPGRTVLASTLLVAVLVGLSGCGSAQAPAADPDTASGRSLQKTCPLLATALRQGMVGSQALTDVAETAASLKGAGDRQTAEAIADLPGAARALAASPDSESDLAGFQRGVRSTQRACTRIGSPMRY